MRFTREQLGLPTAVSKALVRRLEWWSKRRCAALIDPHTPEYVAQKAHLDEADGYLYVASRSEHGTWLALTAQGLQVLADGLAAREVAR